MSEGIIVAAIGAIGVIMAASFQVMRKENRGDHAVVADSLNRIEIKLDNHINDHLKGDV